MCYACYAEWMNGIDSMGSGQSRAVNNSDSILIFIINRTILQCRDLNLMLKLSNRTNSMLNTHFKYFSQSETIHFLTIA